LYEVAGLIGRRVYLQNFIIEHKHNDYGKRKADETDSLRNNRIPLDVETWKETVELRKTDAKKLKKYIDSYKHRSCT
jgi:hypothetical protein